MLGKQCTGKDESDKVVMLGVITNIRFLEF